MVLTGTGGVSMIRNSIHSLIFFVAAVPFAACDTQPTDNNTETHGGAFPLAVETRSGTVEGSWGEASLYFKGIPYAEPPVGDLRWQPPADKAPWQGVRLAHEFSPACPQPESPLSQQELVWDEDCLCLNIYRPKEHTTNLPVMVFIHGGSHITGSGSLSYYDGEWLAQNKKIVLATINYRLGQFGYLYLPEAGITGNYGTLDQIKALEWINNNIEAFGGDPDNITLFGESAGGISVGMLLALAPELFDKAIIQSGIIYYNADSISPEKASEQGKAFAREIGCDQAGDVGACLGEKSAGEVLTTGTGNANFAVPGNQYGPVLDGVLVHDTPLEMIIKGTGRDIPLIMGVNADEGTLFAYFLGIETKEDYENWVRSIFSVLADHVLRLYPADNYREPWLAAADVLGDAVFVCSTRETLKKLSLYNNRLYQYYFTYATDDAVESGFGAFHAAELGYVFHTFASETAAAEQVSQNLTELWTRFAYDGVPSCNDTVWPPFTYLLQHYLSIDEQLSTGMYLKKDTCDFWDWFINP